MLKHVFSFSGRAGRLEYLFHSVADIFGIFAVIFAISFIESHLDVSVSEEAVAVSILVVILVGMIAEMSVTVRRFHDLGMSGWYLFATVIPIYSIYLALILFLKGGEGSRK